MLEGAPETLSNGKKKSDQQLQESDKEIAGLKAKPAQRDELIVELLTPVEQTPLSVHE